MGSLGHLIYSWFSLEFMVGGWVTRFWWDNKYIQFLGIRYYVFVVLLFFLLLFSCYCILFLFPGFYEIFWLIFFHFFTVMVLFLFLFGACHLYHSLLRSSLVLFSLASSFLVGSFLLLGSCLSWLPQVKVITEVAILVQFVYGCTNKALAVSL